MLLCDKMNADADCWVTVIPLWSSRLSVGVTGHCVWLISNGWQLCCVRLWLLAFPTRRLTRRIIFYTTPHTYVTQTMLLHMTHNTCN